MKEIPLPDGVKPLDIFVGSIAKERQTEAIPGRNGVVDYGTNYTERSVDLSMWIVSGDTIDYRLLRNELYALFDTGNAFYIAESNVPSRVLKVAVDESYIPERITRIHASVEISCRTLDSVFWESIYTTLELHDSGYSATAEKYGLVDNIDDEKVNYRFTESNFTVYNAGNVTVEPEFMSLEIYIRLVTSDGDFTIKNDTTGEEFKYYRTINGRNLRLNGVDFREGTINGFRDTNRTFIRLVPGINRFTISGATFEEARFNFKYYYK